MGCCRKSIKTQLHPHDTFFTDTVVSEIFHKKLMKLNSHLKLFEIQVQQFILFEIFYYYFLVNFLNFLYISG